MKQELKFNAYIPDLGIMLTDVCVYSGGDIGLGYDEFSAELKLVHPEYTIGDEGEIIHMDDDNDIYDTVFSVMMGEDWIQIDSGKVEVLQYTGFKNKRWVEIYAKHVVQLPDLSAVTIEWLNGCFGWWVRDANGKSFAPLCIAANAEMLMKSEVLGYIFNDKFKIK